MAVILVTLAQARKHLRDPPIELDVDIILKLDQATAIVMRHLKSQANPTWTPFTVPKPVQAAVLCVLEDLHEHRPINAELFDRLLIPYRDPALA